jgi:hypothetical protein
MAWTRDNKINFAMMVITLLAAIAAWVPPVRDLIASQKRPTAEILEPKNDEKLRGSTHRVHGTSKNVPAGKDLWLVVRIASGLWFPVEKCDTNSDGSWSLQPDDVHLGAAAEGTDLGVYTLSLYLVGPSESEPFQAYVRGRDAGKDAGLMSLPGGAQYLTSISVIRTS